MIQTAQKEFTRICIFFQADEQYTTMPLFCNEKAGIEIGKMNFVNCFDWWKQLSSTITGKSNRLTYKFQITDQYPHHHQPFLVAFHSASSTDASIRRRTNPTATPIRTSPLIMAAILKISPAALQVEERAPPPFFPFPFDGYFKELTIFANDWSAQTGRPKETTLLWAFKPPKELSPVI